MCIYASVSTGVVVMMKARGLQNDTNGPCIYLEAVTVCGVEEYFGGNIVGSPTYRSVDGIRSTGTNVERV